MATTTPTAYKSSAGNLYSVIASRGDERLLLASEYAVHPVVGGCAIFRFGLVSDAATPLLHTFHFRGVNRVKDATAPGWDFLVTTKRLNKIAIPLFQPAPLKAQAVAAGDATGVWPILASWIKEQAESDGFTLTVDVADLIRTAFDAGGPDLATVKLVVEFPDLKAQPKPQPPIKLVEWGTDDEEDSDDETVN